MLPIAPLMIEHKRFFLRCMNYFTQEEKEAMLKEEWEFDKNLIHQIYKEKISAWNTIITEAK